MPTKRNTVVNGKAGRTTTDNPIYHLKKNNNLFTLLILFPEIVGGPIESGTPLVALLFHLMGKA